ALQWITLLWFRSGSGPGKISRQILERVEPGQHPPERQGGDDRDADDRPKAGDGAQIISADPGSASGLKFSSRRTQVMQRISLSTISDGLKGASLRVADTRCRAIEAWVDVADRSTSCRSSCSQEKAGIISSR